MKRLFTILLAVLSLLSLTACGGSPTEETSQEPLVDIQPQEPEAPPEPTPEELAAQEVEDLLASLTLEEKVGQLFFVRVPDTDAVSDVSTYHLGGYILFGRDTADKTADALIQTIQSYQDAAAVDTGIPLLIGVDEEGGRVSRLSSIGVTDILDPMATYGAQGDTARVHEIGQTLGTQLGSVGFNIDFAPVADVVTNPNNTEIGDRSFSSDPQVAADMVAAMVEGLQSSGTISCLKHFPGHGSTEADTHEGLSVTSRTLEELRQTELLPFRAGIDAGVEMVMISHMSAPAITGDNTPCDLSPAIVTDLLREELGFTGVIVTDSHEMGAITNYYGCGEAAVKAIAAGCDIVLMPNNLEEAAGAVLTALENGELTEARINESVLRILTLKYRYGILE